MGVWEVKHSKIKVSNGTVGFIRDEGGILGVTNKQVQTERVCWGVKVDDVKLIFESEKWNGSEQQLSRKHLWTIVVPLHVWCESESCCSHKFQKCFTLHHFRVHCEPGVKLHILRYFHIFISAIPDFNHCKNHHCIKFSGFLEDQQLQPFVCSLCFPPAKTDALLDLCYLGRRVLGPLHEVVLRCWIFSWTLLPCWVHAAHTLLIDHSVACHVFR